MYILNENGEKERHFELTQQNTIYGTLKEIITLYRHQYHMMHGKDFTFHIIDNPDNRTYARKLNNLLDPKTFGMPEYLNEHEETRRTMEIIDRKTKKELKKIRKLMQKNTKMTQQIWSDHCE